MLPSNAFTFHFSRSEAHEAEHARFYSALQVHRTLLLSLIAHHALTRHVDTEPLKAGSTRSQFRSAKSRHHGPMVMTARNRSIDLHSPQSVRSYFSFVYRNNKKGNKPLRRCTVAISSLIRKSSSSLDSGKLLINRSSAIEDLKLPTISG